MEARKKLSKLFDFKLNSSLWYLGLAPKVDSSIFKLPQPEERSPTPLPPQAKESKFKQVQKEREEAEQKVISEVLPKDLTGPTS